MRREGWQRLLYQSRQRRLPTAAVLAPVGAVLNALTRISESALPATALALKQLAFARLALPEIQKRNIAECGGAREEIDKA